MEQAVTAYLKHLNIPVSEQYCKKRIASHPDYPSILAVADTLQQINRAVQNEIAAARIKNSPDVFTSLLYKQRQVDTTPFEHDFLIGSPDAPVKLTMAVNLYCGPCKNELEQAKELMSIYSGQINLTLLLLKSGDDGETSGLVLKTRLGSLKQRNNGFQDGQALIDAWYGVMDAEKFLESHPVNGALPVNETELYLQAHNDWVKNAGITKTPTTFINGYELPAAYRVRDLRYLIVGFSEQHLVTRKDE